MRLDSFVIVGIFFLGWTFLSCYAFALLTLVLVAAALDKRRR